MPILDVDKSRTVMVIKRSMGAGFAGIENPLYHLDKTLMLFGDAKSLSAMYSRIERRARMTVIESGRGRIRRKKIRRGFDFVLVCA